MSTVKILFFATLRDKAGVRAIEMELSPGTTISQLNLLIEKYPNLNGLMDHCLASINHDYHFDESEIPAEAEIAFFPPVSGG